MTNLGDPRMLEPVHAGEGDRDRSKWSHWLVLFLRVMAIVSIAKGLYHWAVICGINAPFPSGFDSYPTSYQVSTVFFAVIDLVAGVGLWLAAPWGAVLWLTAVTSRAAIEVLFPQIYGGSMLLVGAELIMLALYLCLALMAAREQPA
jgi:hypothetical protein